MTIEEMNEIIKKLRDREIERVHVEKEDIMAFAEIIRNSEDFLHFRGIGQRGGSATYEYLDEARS
jgi:hypothetical protein